MEPTYYDSPDGKMRIIDMGNMKPIKTTTLKSTITTTTMKKGTSSMARKPVIKVGDKVRIINDVPYASFVTKGKEYQVVRTGVVTASDVEIKTDNPSEIYTQIVRPEDFEKVVKKRSTTKSVALPKKKMESHEIVGQDHNKKMLNIAISKDLPVLLIGETGTGKTSIIREQAIVRKADWVRFNLTGETTVDEFVGKYELEGGKTVWRDGILLQAMKKGQWLIVDEINVALPEILFVLHSLLDDDKFVVVASHSGEVIKPHKEFRFFATMNPTDEYAGTKELNKAFQSRFSMVLKLHYPDNETESRIVQDKTGVDASTANKMADVAAALRKAKEEDKIFYTCSTRDLLQWGNLVNELDLEDAFIVSILNKANGDADAMVQIYDKIVGKHIALEKKGYTLSIDWFTKEAKKIETERAKFEDDKESIRREITEQIVRKLTEGGADSETPRKVTVEAPEVTW